MKNILMQKRCFLVGLVLFSGIIGIKSALASITLNNPISGSSNNTFLLNYTISEAPNAGTVALVFTGVSATRTISLSNSQSVSFSINPTLNLTTAYPANITSVTGGTTIPDDVYSVQMSYQNSGGTVTSAAASSVTIDTVTTTPTLTAPASSSSNSNLVAVQFSVPETALSGSRKLTFSNAGSTIVITLKDSTLTSFNLDLSADPITNSNVQSATAASVPSGTYSVSFSYQDALGNSVAQSTNTNVAVTYGSTAAPAAAVASSGGGCFFVKDIRDQQNKKNGSPFETLFWFMICAAAVLLLKKKQIHFKH